MNGVLKARCAEGTRTHIAEEMRVDLCDAVLRLCKALFDQGQISGPSQPHGISDLKLAPAEHAATHSGPPIRLQSIALQPILLDIHHTTRSILFHDFQLNVTDRDHRPRCLAQIYPAQ